ncbi:MAG: hypothetical protein ACLSB9_11205 [Hydrogeniiclostridium mannosilyticum]
MLGSARNMQNFRRLREIGKSGFGLLKRESLTVESTDAAEYIMSEAIIMWCCASGESVPRPRPEHGCTQCPCAVEPSTRQERRYVEPLALAGTPVRTG